MNEWHKVYVRYKELDAFIQFAFANGAYIFGIVSENEVTAMPSIYIRGYWVYYKRHDELPARLTETPKP